MADLYENDILLWSERQGELLRRRGAGEMVNEADLDWPNIAEEIESVARSELRACTSLLQKALERMLNAAAWPQSPEAPSWRADTISFRLQAADAFTPCMRLRIDIEHICRRALRVLPATIDRQSPSPLPERCPVTLDDRLADET